MKIGTSCDRVIALDGDMKNSTYSQDYKKAFPDRFIECFIAEQNMVSKNSDDNVLVVRKPYVLRRLVSGWVWLAAIELSRSSAPLLLFCVELTITYAWGLSRILTATSSVHIVGYQLVNLQLFYCFINCSQFLSISRS